MAQTGFQLQNWSRLSASANEPLQTSQVGGLIEGCFRKYGYYSPVDTQATCSASGYFNTVAYDLVTGDYVEIYSLAEGSLINYFVTNTAGVITLQAIGGNVTTVVTVTLAQFLAGYATPLLVLAAPGAGLAYTNVNANMVFTYGSAQLANGGDSYLQYGSTADGAGPMATSSVSGTGIAALTASSVWPYGSGSTTASPATPSIANLGLYLTNATAPFITGTGATFKLNLRASIIAAA